MSSTTLVIVCAVAAILLIAVLGAVMLAPTRLRRPFAEGYTRRQWAAYRERWRVQARKRAHRR